MSDFLPTILATSYTKSDILRRIHLLRGYLESVHFKKSDVPLRDYLVSKNASKSDIEVLSKWKLEPKGELGRTELYKTIEKIMSSIAKLPSITLFVPFEPDSESIERIGTWVRQEVTKETIVDIRLDPEAIGGARIAWNGSYGDYSLSRILDREKDFIRSMLVKKMAKT